MSDLQIFSLFDPLFSNVVETNSFPQCRPLLAHYTSVPALEAILRNNEIWFSNPLFMNDIEEVRFGINTGTDLFLTSAEVESACDNKERFEALKSALSTCYNFFADNHLIDTYVFCLSEHDLDDIDGLLSMWRGYGGNGNGVAIIFDTAKLSEQERSPLVISKVRYASVEQRTQILRGLITKFCEILKRSAIPNDKLIVAAHAFFECLKIVAIFTKDKGFSEEREWRVVYMRERDQGKSFDAMFSYAIGHKGVEPKLKFKIEYMPDLAEPEFSLSKIIDRIILGPSLSSPLAQFAITKMIEALGRTELKERMICSTIPFRSG